MTLAHFCVTAPIILMNFLHADDTAGTSTTVPATSQTTRPPGGVTGLDEVDDTGLIVGAVATVIAGTFVLLACFALFITILVKFGRRKRPAQRSGRLHT